MDEQVMQWYGIPLLLKGVKIGDQLFYFCK